MYSSFFARIFCVPHFGICIPQCEIYIPQCGFCIPQCGTENLPGGLQKKIGKKESLQGRKSRFSVLYDFVKSSSFVRRKKFVVCLKKVVVRVSEPDGRGNTINKDVK